MALTTEDIVQDKQDAYEKCFNDFNNSLTSYPINSEFSESNRGWTKIIRDYGNTDTGDKLVKKMDKRASIIQEYISELISLSVIDYPIVHYNFSRSIKVNENND